MAIHMTKRQAIALFNKTIKKCVIARYGKTDKAAMREAWNNFTDALCKAGDISLMQYETW